MNDYFSLEYALAPIRSSAHGGTMQQDVPLLFPDTGVLLQSR
jgi:hypothetical protein